MPTTSKFAKNSRKGDSTREFFTEELVIDFIRPFTSKDGAKHNIVAFKELPGETFFPFENSVVGKVESGAKVVVTGSYNKDSKGKEYTNVNFIQGDEGNVSADVLTKIKAAAKDGAVLTF